MKSELPRATTPDRNRATTMPVPVTPTMLPYASRRAVAIAIDLEHAVDRMAAYAGVAVRIDRRIVAHGARTMDRKRLHLPRECTLTRLLDMQQHRLEVLRSVHAVIAETLGDDERTQMDEILDEAEERIPAEWWANSPRRRRITRPDAVTVADDEGVRRGIEAAADAPDEDVAMPVTPPAPSEPLPNSIAVEIMLDGLLRHHAVDRDALHAEVRAAQAASGRRITDLASPSARSNVAVVLHALGRDFPPCLLEIQGDALGLASLELPVLGGDPYDVWRYRGGRRPHELRRDDAMRGVDVFSFPRRPIATMLSDPRMHSALVVREVRRQEDERSLPITIIALYPRYGHLDPPGAAASQRPTPEPVSLDELPADNYARQPLEIEVDATLIERLMAEIGALGPTRTSALADGRVRVDCLHDNGSIAAQTTFQPPDLAKGASYMQRRLTGLAARGDEHVAAERARLAKLAEERRIQDERRAQDEQRRAIAAERRRLRTMRTLVRALGDGHARMIRDAPFIDTILDDMIDEHGPWREQARAERGQVRLARYDDVVVVQSANIGEHVRYVCGGTARHRGRTVVIGVMTIRGEATHTMIEHWRGGPLGGLISWQGARGRGTVTKVRVVGDEIVASIELPVVAQEHV